MVDDLDGHSKLCQFQIRIGALLESQQLLFYGTGNVHLGDDLPRVVRVDDNRPELVGYRIQLRFLLGRNDINLRV